MSEIPREFTSETSKIRFQLDGRVGVGKFGTVHRANLDLSLGQNAGYSYALKVFNEDPEIDMFTIESQAYNVVEEHDNIVRRLEQGAGRFSISDQARGAKRLAGVAGQIMEDGGRLRNYMLMEYAPGGNLKMQGPLPAREVVRMVGYVSDALQHIHNRGHVYRDLKTHNVLVAGDRKYPVYKIADLGGVALKFDPANPDNTRQQIVVATLESTNFEEMMAGEATPQTDVYATGLLMAEALTGVRAKRDKESSPRSLEELTRMPRAVAMNREIASLEEVYDKATQPHPGDRYQSAADLKDAVIDSFDSFNSRSQVIIDNAGWSYKVIEPEDSTSTRSDDNPETVTGTMLGRTINDGFTRVMGNGTAFANAASDIDDLNEKLRNSNAEKGALSTLLEDQQAQHRKDIAKKDEEIARDRREKADLEGRLRTANTRIDNLKQEAKKSPTIIEAQPNRRWFLKFASGAAIAAAGFSGWNWYKEKYKFNPDIEQIGAIVNQELDGLMAADNAGVHRNSIAKALIDAGNNDAALTMINKLKESGSNYLAADAAAELAPSDPDLAHQTLDEIYAAESENPDSSILDEIQGYYLRLAPYKKEIVEEIQAQYAEDDPIWKAMQSALNPKDGDYASDVISDLLDEGYAWYASRLVETLAPYQSDVIADLADHLADYEALFGDHLTAVEEADGQSRPTTRFETMMSMVHSLIPPKDLIPFDNDKKRAHDLTLKVEEMTRPYPDQVAFSGNLAHRLAAFDPATAESIVESYETEPEYFDNDRVKNTLESLRFALMPDHEPTSQPFLDWQGVMMDPHSLENINLAVAALKSTYEDESDRAYFAHQIAKGLIYAHAKLGFIENASQLFTGWNGFYTDYKAKVQSESETQTES